MASGHEGEAQCAAPRRHTQLARCVDCKKPLFSRTWKEKLKGQFRATFLWPSKKRQDMPFGRYTVKQRCGECQVPLRCAACSEAFFENLSSEEIRVFMRALVLFAMKALCGDCNRSFRCVHCELFDDGCGAPAAAPRPGAAVGWDSTSPSPSPSPSPDIIIDGAITNPKVLDDIRLLEEYSAGRKLPGADRDLLELKGGVVLGDWKREMNRFHLVLER